MLEPVCLCMDRVEFEFERLGKVELEQPVVAGHLQRDSLAGSREAHSAVELVIYEPHRRKTLHHAGRGRGSDAHLPRQRRRLDTSSVTTLKLVDLAEVVLDRVAEVRRLRRGSRAHPTRSPVAYMTTIPAR
jgi:hypothetical protein